MSLLRDRVVLVTGVLTEGSIAFHVARIAQQEGASVVLTSFGRAERITRVVARRLPTPAPVIRLDVTNDEDVAALADRVREHTDRLDGLLHSMAFAPAGAFSFLEASWADVEVALRVSAFSLKDVAAACSSLLTPGSGIVGLTFDARYAWPGYDWMGVAKAAFESANRYCARDLGGQGIRCNLVAAGPLRTPAARSRPDFESVARRWSRRSPLGWDAGDHVPTARACVALLSDWFPATTGEVVHVDGGYHLLG